MNDNQDIRLWLAAYTAPGAEIAVRDAVREMGYPVLVPMAPVEVRHARQAMIVDRPVFPRYAFVGIPVGRSWYPIKNTTGVSGILSASAEPRPVPPRVVKMLRDAVEANAFAEVAKPEFEEGQPVKVNLAGAELDAFVTKVRATLPGQRIGVVMEFFGKKQNLSVPVANVRAA